MQAGDHLLDQLPQGGIRILLVEGHAGAQCTNHRRDPVELRPGKHVLQALPLHIEVLVRSRHQPRQQRGLRQLAPASPAGPEDAAHAGRVGVEEHMLEGAVQVVVVEHVRQAMDGHAGTLGEVERRRHLPLVIFARGEQGLIGDGVHGGRFGSGYAAHAGHRQQHHRDRDPSSLVHGRLLRPQRRAGGPQRVIRGKHPVVAVPVFSRRWHKVRNTAGDAPRSESISARPDR